MTISEIPTDSQFQQVIYLFFSVHPALSEFILLFLRYFFLDVEGCYRKLFFRLVTFLLIWEILLTPRFFHFEVLLIWQFTYSYWTIAQIIFSLILRLVFSDLTSTLQSSSPSTTANSSFISSPPSLIVASWVLLPDYLIFLLVPLQYHIFSDFMSPISIYSTSTVSPFQWIYWFYWSFPLFFFPHVQAVCWDDR